MNSFDVALAGCGKVAGLLDNQNNDSCLSHAAGIFSQKELTLSAICDSSEAHLASFQSKWKVTRVFNSLKRLLDDHRPDLLCISTPTALHYKHLCEAVSSGVPLIFMEKPLCETLDQSQELRRIYAGAKSEVLVNYFRRFNPALRRLREELANNQYGSVLRVHIYYNKGLLHNGSHLIDLVQWLIGAVTDIDHIHYYRDVFGDDLDVDVCMRVNSKIPVTMEVFHYEHYNLLEVDILTEEFRVRLVNGGREIHLFKGTEDPYFPHLKQLIPADWPVENPWKIIYSYAYRHCVDILKGDSSPFCTVENAADLVDLVIRVKQEVTKKIHQKKV